MEIHAKFYSTHKFDLKAFFDVNAGAISPLTEQTSYQKK